MAWEGRHGHAYDQPAFRYLLALERVRSWRSGFPLMLLLVELKPRPEAKRVIDAACTARLFSALSMCCRETDIVGWYRRERVAGVVLTELGEGSPPDLSLVAARVTDVLNKRLPMDITHRVLMRIRQKQAPQPPRASRATSETISGDHRCSTSL